MPKCSVEPRLRELQSDTLIFAGDVDQMRSRTMAALLPAARCCSGSGPQLLLAPRLFSAFVSVPAAQLT